MAILASTPKPRISVLRASPKRRVIVWQCEGAGVITADKCMRVAYQDWARLVAHFQSETMKAQYL
jgi:hypothetical protein